jgi:hypothetical protein
MLICLQGDVGIKDIVSLDGLVNGKLSKYNYALGDQ